MKKALLFFSVIIVLPMLLLAMESNQKITQKQNILNIIESIISDGTLDEFKAHESELDSVDCSTIQHLQRIATFQHDALEVLHKVIYPGTMHSLAYQSLKKYMKKLEKIHKTITQQEYITQEQKKIAHIQVALKEQEDQFFWSPIKYDKRRDLYYFLDPRRKKTEIICSIAKRILYNIGTSHHDNVQEYIKDVLKPIHKLACINREIHKSIYNLVYDNNYKAHRYNTNFIKHCARNILYKNQAVTDVKLNMKLAAAYIGTPLALELLENDLKNLPLDDIKVLLDARLTPDNQLESFDELLKKFPKSTQHFCNTFIQQRQK